LGSFFAGIKAGTLGGILYLGGLAIFNVLLLYALKQDVLSYIQSSYSSICVPGGSANATSVNSCFSLVVSVYVPFDAFIGYFVALVYAGLLGMFYDILPTKVPALKGGLVAAIVGVSLVYFDLAGFFFDTTSALATSVFLIFWTGVFGYVLGRLYTRYTRLVKIESQDQALLRVFVDGRDCTGKARTFAHTSNHKLRAEVADDASFREWQVEGGLSIEDARSFDTVMEVNGTGTLRGIVTKKY
jgi:hypothetical protein